MKKVGDLPVKQYLENLKAKIFTIKNIPWKSPRVIGGSLALLLLMGSGIVYLNSTTSAVFIVVNGEKLGLVADQGQAGEMINQILTEKGEPFGIAAKTHDSITYSSVRIKNAEFRSLSKSDLAEDISYYVDGVMLKVNKEPIFVLANAEDGEKLLKDFQEYYTKPSDKNQVSSVSFEDEVETQPVEAPLEQIISYEQALEKLKQGNLQKVEYTVQEKDSWWLIARKNDMKTKEVLASNPGTNEDTILKPGEKIMLDKISPYITVVSEGVRTDTETIPFDVVTQTDTSLPSGETKVKQPGSDGQKEVQYAYVQKNGQVVTQTVKDEKVLKEAVSQIIEKGPQRVTVASSRGSGSIVSGLSWPLRGPITSYYGYRHSEYHTGIDIAGDQGDPYTAASAGKVVSAGYSGNYGYTITIDHGNGVMTRYAHSTKLLVSAGQSVSKGQTIGLVGSTGRSTGSHLHFEVIVNGDTVNPLNSLR
ncbi:LysM peptidoglycan-binding domain-containing M23 family metallopeptidase [Desulfosporosinus nitroreducens]|uniref:LysM peptidoglycan-binding domain-containing M23 family metallopeptidase n=1 Tax=Desulfosporosinus nitroreducens TaxID=2018668 RepID=UPI00207D12A1|nr:peptidoglycan DD-metalloendopeptidase family protein [Desulfosporosinus nitroreducens]MCO1602475.1 peptidoglycan DD-metalloendopeptidase family protein [Desulfosporosinus nitroreducens]